MSDLPRCSFSDVTRPTPRCSDYSTVRRVCSTWYNFGREITELFSTCTYPSYTSTEIECQMEATSSTTMVTQVVLNAEMTKPWTDPIKWHPHFVIMYDRLYLGESTGLLVLS